MSASARFPRSTPHSQVPAPPLAEVVQREAGQNAYLCYQCLKCSSGCPLSGEMDLLPNQIMRAVQLGDDQRALASKTIWLCASCQACTTRCPQGLDVAGIMDTLRIEALKRDIPPAVPDIALFNRLFLANIALFGRLYEVGLIAGMNIATRKLTKDLGMGLQMVKRRKIKLVPAIVRTPRRVRKVEQAPDRIAYYPGCSLHSSAGEYDRSTRAVCKALGLDLIEPPGWVCCGSTPAHATDPSLAARLPLRNLAIIEQMGFDTVAAPCSACYSRFKSAVHTVEERPDIAADIEKKTRYRYQGSVNILHLLDLLVDHVGVTRISERVRQPLHISAAAGSLLREIQDPKSKIQDRERPLRVACYYGCLLTRPPRVTGAEHPEYPVKMDQLVRALGAEPVDWSCKTECCGAALGMTRTAVAVKLSARILQNAHDCGADVIATACPLCHVNLDARQRQLGLDFQLPVLYLTQLMAMAFGMEQQAALDKNMVDPRLLYQCRASVSR